MTRQNLFLEEAVMYDWQSRLRQEQAHRSREKEQDRKQKEDHQRRREHSQRQIAEERNHTQRQIAEDRQKLEIAKIEMNHLQRKEENQIKLTTAEIERKKELELVFANYQSTYNLKEQDLEHGFLTRKDEHQKEIELRNGEYNYNLKRDRQAQGADFRKTALQEYGEYKRTELRTQADITRTRLEQAGQTERTQIVETNKAEMQKRELGYKVWEVETRHIQALEMEDKRAEVYERNAIVDTQQYRTRSGIDDRSHRTREKTITKELIKRNFNDSINYAFRKAVDTKMEIKIIEAKARSLGWNPSSEELEGFIRRNKDIWSNDF